MHQCSHCLEMFCPVKRQVWNWHGFLIEHSARRKCYGSVVLIQSFTVILLQRCFLHDIISQMCFVAGERETMSYFASHFEQQVQIYKKLVRCLKYNNFSE